MPSRRSNAFTLFRVIAADVSPVKQTFKVHIKEHKQKETKVSAKIHDEPNIHMKEATKHIGNKRRFMQI
jgi:hypothetical protein